MLYKCSYRSSLDCVTSQQYIKFINFGKQCHHLLFPFFMNVQNTLRGESTVLVVCTSNWIHKAFTLPSSTVKLCIKTQVKP